MGSLFGKSDVRNGWPYDYHRSFWENYDRHYAQPWGSYDWDFSYPYRDYPYHGPREESYLWGMTASPPLPVPAATEPQWRLIEIIPGGELRNSGKNAYFT